MIRWFENGNERRMLIGENLAPFVEECGKDSLGASTWIRVGSADVGLKMLQRALLVLAVEQVPRWVGGADHVRAVDLGALRSDGFWLQPLDTASSPAVPVGMGPYR